METKASCEPCSEDITEEQSLTEEFPVLERKLSTAVNQQALPLKQTNTDRNIRRQTNTMSPKTSNSPKASLWNIKGGETKSLTAELFEMVSGD